MKLVIVSGLSGSGKSIALHALEDLGYYCIDNLPLALLPAFAEQFAHAKAEYELCAVGVDARNLNENFHNFPELLAQVRSYGLDCEILYLKSDDQTLIKRFSETRRKHPLTKAEVSLPEAIERDRELLAPLAQNANWVVDTSRTNVHQLRDLIRDYMHNVKPSLSLTILSFGFKHGAPLDADFVFDIRCLPNPHWVPELRALTGKDAPVAAFLESQDLVKKMYDQLSGFLDTWIPAFEDDSRTYMTVAIGCTGGQHRSVYMAEALSEFFSQQRDNVLVRHRELSV